MTACIPLSLAPSSLLPRSVSTYLFLDLPPSRLIEEKGPIGYFLVPIIIRHPAPFLLDQAPTPTIHNELQAIPTRLMTRWHFRLQPVMMMFVFRFPKEQRRRKKG
mmetsp:Transcript_44246/g.87293  ORF Transcript_44246/g.87293 Transcript_44246/m.87293 type:complete len:105 (-) Transcript_44246:282-596(-)